MEPDLIDHYLDELQRSLPRRRSIPDVMAEVEDHLRESADRLTAQGVDATTAQRLTLDRFGDLTVITRAFATHAGGLAMTTTFTRAAGTTAYVAAGLWLTAGATSALKYLVDSGDDMRLYTTAGILASLATIATAIVIAGALSRSGGVRDPLAFLALALMVVATILMAVAPWAWVLTAAPLTGAAIITVHRMRSVGLTRPWSDWSLMLAWPAGVLVVIVGEALRFGPHDYYGDYPWAFVAGINTAILVFCAGLIGVGTRLRSERTTSARARYRDPGMTVA